MVNLILLGVEAQQTRKETLNCKRKLQESVGSSSMLLNQDFQHIHPCIHVIVSEQYLKLINLDLLYVF